MPRALNLTLFGKVVALARSTPHVAGEHTTREQKAAWVRAERMAGDAGLSLTAALSKIDGKGKGPNNPIPQQPEAAKDPFFSFFDELAKKQKAASGLKWPEHPWEAALRVALEGHPIEGMSSFVDDLPEATLDVLKNAIPWPTTMVAAIKELREWDTLREERRDVAEHYCFGDGPQARYFLVLDLMRGEAVNVDDMVGRAEWAIQARLDGYDMPEYLALMAADMQRMRHLLAKAELRQAPREQTSGDGYATNKAKRERVKEILMQPGGLALSLRELAKRAGVSIQGAANIKASLFKQAVKN